MSRKAQNVVVALSLGILLTFGIRGTALATDQPGHDDGFLPISSAPWGPANQDPIDPLKVVVNYEVKASGNVPQSAVDAVHAGIQAWIDAINGRERGWEFNLVGVGSSSPGPSGARSPLFGHNPNAPRNHGGGGDTGDTGDGVPHIQIQLRKGGGLIAGQAQSTVEDGFRVGGRIKISGGFLGNASAAVTITEITMHELGHLLGLVHHFNENDLMGPTVGHTNGSPIISISGCDLDGFEEANHWLTMDGTDTPHPNHVTSIFCP